MYLLQNEDNLIKHIQPQVINETKNDKANTCSLRQQPPTQTKDSPTKKWKREMERRKEVNYEQKNNKLMIKHTKIITEGYLLYAKLC